MTSISDRCKTAREKATPGPWEASVSLAGTGILVAQQDYTTIDNWVNLSDLRLIALAPEAADEVVRLTTAIEDLAMWHMDRADEARDDYVLMKHSAVVDQLRRILNPNGDTND